MTYSEKLLSLLKNFGIEYIFGVIGREATSISFDSPNSPKFILTRHETTAGMAAIAMSRFTNKPQVCFGTLGPGFTNFITTIATAMVDRDPIIVITAQAETDSIIYNNVHQCIDLVSIAKPITKFSIEVTNENDIISVLELAIRKSMSFPYGPSFISLPINIMTKEIKRSIILSEINKFKVLSPNISSNLNKVYKKVSSIIKKSKTPIIIVGNGVLKSDIYPSLLRELSEKMNIPIVSTYSAKGILPHHHELNYGVISSHLDVLLGFPALEYLFKNNDLIILIGYDLVEHFPSAWSTNKKVKIISISEYKGKEDIFLKPKPEISVYAPIDKVCKMLIKDGSLNKKNNISDYSKIKNMLDYIKNESKKDNQKITPPSIMSSLDIIYPDGYIIANDIGMNRHTSAVYFESMIPNDFLTSAGFSSFGTGVGLGIGAQIANPNKKVIVIAGDGGFHAHSGDLETAARLNLPLIILVLKNNSNSLIKRFQKIGKYKKLDSKVTDFIDVDFKSIAIANKCAGYKVNNINDLLKYLHRAGKNTKPSILEIDIDYSGII
ncbi:MAG: thiamine pyrophosphate-binding protein [Patescibacteria group bacterium]|nr:thiamine pyrophosphate-binding protein [Patescibacteria group bacterium]